MKIILKCENCGSTNLFHRRTALKYSISRIEKTYECKKCGEHIDTIQYHKSSKK